MRSIVVGTLAAVLMMAPPVSAHGQAPTAERPGGVSAAAQCAAAVVDAFHAALGRGDTKSAAALLAEDALIFESGGVERTKSEYAGHHLPADAEFSSSVSSTVTHRWAHSSGAMAWVASEGRTSGTFKGRPIDLITTETMVLRKVGRSWKILHVHWSSAAKSKG